MTLDECLKVIRDLAEDKAVVLAKKGNSNVFRCRVFKEGEDLVVQCDLPEDGRVMLESLLVVIQTASAQLRVTPYQLLSDLAAMDQGRVKWT